MQLKNLKKMANTITFENRPPPPKWHHGHGHGHDHDHHGCQDYNPTATIDFIIPILALSGLLIILLKLKYMKKLKFVAFIFMATLLSAQDISPVITLKHTGGLSYDMDHEYNSMEIGIYTDLSEKKYMLLEGYYITAEILYDNTALYSKQLTGTDRDKEVHTAKTATILKISNLAKIKGSLAFTYTVGMGFTNEKSPAPIPVFGLGLMTKDLPINAGLSFENIAGKNHLALSTYFHLDRLFNRSKRWTKYR